MKWIPKDIETYLTAKEYVDTAVLPLLPVSFDHNIKQTAAMTEFISMLVIQLEKQFKGRIILLPGYTYIKSDNEDKLLGDITNWEQELKSNGFKHIFYATSDSDWKKHESELEGTLLWIPSIPLDDLDENYRMSLLDDQVKQLLNLFVQKWQEKA